MLEAIARALNTAITTPRLLLRSDPADYYRYLGEDIVEGRFKERSDDTDKPLWLNLGYWKQAHTYPEAAEALATLVAEAAGLGSQDDVLDVGFGFAEQDFFWVRQFGVKHITGANVTEMQVRRAHARLQARGLDQRIQLHVASATALPFRANSFDVVVALECAFHFNPREQFFREAFRVLRPGGRLVTADGTSSTGDRPLGIVSKLALRRWAVPLVNMYDSDEYCRRLSHAGFGNVRHESIRQYVFPGVLKYQALRQKGQSSREARVELSEEDVAQCKGLELFKITGMTDYVIFSAKKPT